MQKSGDPLRSAPHQLSLSPLEPRDPASHAGGAPSPVGRGTPLRRRQRSSEWLRRIELLVRVIVRLYLGLLIIALPWMRFWTENGLFSYTHAGALLADSGFVRGIVSGLGVLNVAIALQELFLPEQKD